MKKGIIIALVCLVIVGIIIGVVFYINSQKNIEIDVEELAVKIKYQISFKDNLEMIDRETVVKNYSFDDAKIKDVACYIGTGATAEEILVLQVNDRSDINEVKDLIVKRIDERKEAFADYLPDEVYKLENYTLLEKGDYLILCIANDSEGINDIVNDYLKNK